MDGWIETAVGEGGWRMDGGSAREDGLRRAKTFRTVEESAMQFNAGQGQGGEDAQEKK